MKMKIYFGVILFLAVFCAATTVLATTEDDLQATILQLQAQINQIISQQMTQLNQQTSETTQTQEMNSEQESTETQTQTQTQTQQETDASWCYSFNKNLAAGDLNSDVVSLQTALTKEGFNLSGEISGYFGSATKAAVIAFQEKYASETLTPWGLTHGTGFVGSTTRAKLNQLYGCKIITAPISTSCTPDWQCGSWGDCYDGQQIRYCYDYNFCGIDTDKPEESQTCTSTCTPNWQCGSWSDCYNSTKTRYCYDSNYCGTETNKPEETQSCIFSCTPNWSCGAWTACLKGSQSRSCVDNNYCGTMENKPVTTQSCDSSCSSTADSTDIFIKGTTTGSLWGTVPVASYIDSCTPKILDPCTNNTGNVSTCGSIHGGVLTKYYCTSKNTVSYMMYTCLFGCAGNGACKAGQKPILKIQSPDTVSGLQKGKTYSFALAVSYVPAVAKDEYRIAKFYIRNSAGSKMFSGLCNLNYDKINTTFASCTYSWQVSSDIPVGNDYKAVFEVGTYLTGYSEVGSADFNIINTSTVCSDSDGENYFTKGTSTKGSFSGTDTCSGDILTELSCSATGDIVSKTRACPLGCDDGACKKGISVPTKKYQFRRGDTAWQTTIGGTITWSAEGITGSVNIDLVDSVSGATYSIAKNISASAGSYYWPIFNSAVNSLYDPNFKWADNCTLNLSTLNCVQKTASDGKEHIYNVYVSSGTTKSNPTQLLLYTKN